MRCSKTPALLAGMLAAALATDAGAAPASKLTEADYRRAEAMLSANIGPKLLNGSVAPIWLPDGERFWYKRQTATGWNFVAVDPAKATKAAAFDHAGLAAAISAVTGKPATADHLTLANAEFTDSAGKAVAFESDGFALTCDLAASKCQGKAVAAADPNLAVSPDGKIAIFARDHNLWRRNVGTGEERQLTRNGEANFAYGKMADSSLLKVISATKGFALPLFGVDWSPDGRQIYVRRTDERKLQEYAFLQSVPYDGDRRPKVVPVRATLSGEAPAPFEVSLIDVESGDSRVVDVGGARLSRPYWDPSGARFLAVDGGSYSRKTVLFEVTVATGAARPVVTEESKTFLQSSALLYDEFAVRFLPASNEAIWFSQKDGWGHLYLVDVATGQFKAQITKGDWTIQNIVGIDEKTRRVWFTGVGREAGQNPYWRQLYSAGFDGSDLRQLTKEPADHAFPGAVNAEYEVIFRGRGRKPEAPLLAPGKAYFIDTYSTVEKPPVTVLRRVDGSDVMQLEAADATAAIAAGWNTPKPFKVKAADGTTDLYGIVVLPPKFDPKRSYPVIDAIYNGPQVVTTPHNFTDALNGTLTGAQAQAFAQLGFVVVTLDSRGTPMRSKAFQDYIYGNMQEFGLEDHVAAIKQLGAKAPYMDLNRVGLFGHSFGGIATLKGILGYPDFFKVATASAGPYDLYGMYSLDAFFEPPRFKDGGAKASGPADRPTNWGKYDLTQQAGLLKGKLQLAYADLDENAYPAVTARLVDALIAANKEFDLVYMPNRSHAFSNEPYFIRRRWDFFVRNLLGAEPPKDFAMGAK